jgi:predicted nucleic acid-binding protein
VITALDTNAILDLLIPGSSHAASSRNALQRAARSGRMIIAEAVYAELSAHFGDQAELERFLADADIRLEPSQPATLHEAGRAWRVHRDRRPAHLVCPQCANTQAVTCDRCGRNLAPRQHVVADFLIGAHAFLQANQLLTRDRGFYGSYFPGLALS